MQPHAVRIIKDEHLAIAAVLYGLQFLVHKIGDEGDEPNFNLLYAILDYLVEYPERWHHPKENDYLFKVLRQRRPEAGPLIEDLETEHVEGERLIVELRETLRQYENTGTAAFPAFAQAVETYAVFQWDHMRKEEETLLPFAEKSLTEEDWLRIGEAFRQNDNPLFGLESKQAPERLFRRIFKVWRQRQSPPAHAVSTAA